MKLKLVEAVEVTLPEIDETDGELVVRLLNNPDYFPNQTLVQSIKQKLITSIGMYGLDVEDNPFLRFALDSDNKDLGKINSKFIDIIFDRLADGDISFDDPGANGSNIEKWIFNSKAYNGSEYKLNALIILSMPDQLKRFVDKDKRDPEKRPFGQVLDATSDKEIKKILDEYAPNTEEEKENQTLEGDEEEVNSKLFEYFRKLFTDKSKLTDKDLKAIIEASLKKTDDVPKLKLLVQNEVAKFLKVELE